VGTRGDRRVRARRGSGLRADKGWEYSNTNYVLLDTVIEQVTGQPIADVYAERIFGPLGNDADHLPDRDRRHRRPHLYGISNQNQAGKTIVTTDWSPSAAFTARKIISTLDDLKKWGEAPFTGEGILEPATQQPRRDSILYGIPPANSPTAGYGIGTATGTAGGATTVTSPATPPCCSTTMTSRQRSSSRSTATSPRPALEHPSGKLVSPQSGGEGCQDVCQDWSASCTTMAICTRLATSSLVNRRDTCALTVASLRNSEAPTCALEAPDPIATAT